MVIRLVVALVLVAVAVVVAIVVDRRRPDAPTQGWRVPEQLDRRDFDGGDRRWLVVVFTSLTCDSCRSTVEKAQVLASAELAVQEVPYQARQDLHDRYGIDAVPTVVVADDEGVVRAHHIGPCSAADLWSAVADARGET